MKKLPLKSATFNRLDFIDANSPHALDEIRALAEALVLRGGQEREPHWLDGAEFMISAVTATTVFYGQPETRSLQTVRELLANPQRLEMAIRLMCESPAWGGLLARMGGQMQHFKEKELASTLTTTNRFLRFLDTPTIVENTTSSSFDPSKLRTGKMVIFCVLPVEHMRVQSPLLRMWIGSFLWEVVRGGPQRSNKVHFVLEESSSLGHLQQISDALAIGRSFGARLQFYYQDCGQLKKNWPDGQDQTLLSNTTQIFFGVNDNQTAEYVSARLGEETIIVDSGGTTDGGSNQTSGGSSGASQSTGRSWSQSSNWQQHGRKLLKPEEVTALPARTAITFAPGIPPIWTTLLRYFEEPDLLKGSGGGLVMAIRQALSTFITALILFITVAGLAVVLTGCVIQEIKKEMQQQQNQFVPVQPVFNPSFRPMRGR
jgi:type IV secretion system protein VirD4